MKKIESKSSKLLEALESNLPVAIRIAPSPPPKLLFKQPEKEDLISDSEEDYKFSRARLKSLIDKAEHSLEGLMMVAEEAEHPRTYEVLAGMLQTTSDMTDKLMDLQRKRKDILAPQKNNIDHPPNPTNVAVFIGTSADLQKRLSSSSSQIIDVPCSE